MTGLWFWFFCMSSFHESWQTVRTSNVHDKMMNCSVNWGVIELSFLAVVLRWWAIWFLCCCPEPPHCWLYSNTHHTHTLMFVKSQLVFFYWPETLTHVSAYLLFLQTFVERKHGCILWFTVISALLSHQQQLDLSDWTLFSLSIFCQKCSLHTAAKLT